ncbi:acetate--CoA ligase family protein [Chloroflexota bacterium]
MKNMDHFKALFNPKTVAVVGASNNQRKWGGGVFASVLKSPTIKNAYPVNKRVDEVQGVKTYPSVRDLPEPVDFVAIVVPFNSVLEVVQDSVARGAKAGLIITAGLGETGPEGAELQAEIVRTAREGGMRLNGPNCMGHFNAISGFSTVRQGMNLQQGDISVISESGAFAGHILQCGNEMGVGFNKFVSTGNEADLHFEDYLEYLAQDNETKVICGYVEGLREGRRFFDLAKKITKTKPIVLVKVGRTNAGVRAVKSHTSAIAGSDLVYDAMFKQAGVIRVNEVEELFDVALALLWQPLPRGKKVGILTYGGGFGCVASDACEKLGLEIAQLSPHTIERLNEVLPERWPHANPVDTVGFGNVTFPCLWPMIEDDNLDSILVIGGLAQASTWRQRANRGNLSTIGQADSEPSVMEEAEQAMIAMEKEEQKDLEKLFSYIQKYKKPIYVFHNWADRMKDMPVNKLMKDNGIMMYSTPERAARVMSYMASYGQYMNSL